MHPSTLSVLKALKKKRKGITFNDFPLGFRLGARIKDLRDMGADIATMRVAQANGSWHARYVLLAEPKARCSHDND